MSLSNLPGLKLLLLCTLMFPKTSSFNRYNSGFSSDFFSRLRMSQPPIYDDETRKLTHSPTIKSDRPMPIRQASDIDEEVLHSLLTDSKKPDIPKQPSWSQLEDSPAISFDSSKKSAPPNGPYGTTGFRLPSWPRPVKNPTVSSDDVSSFAIKDDSSSKTSISPSRQRPIEQSTHPNSISEPSGNPPPNDSDKHSIVRQPSRSHIKKNSTVSSADLVTLDKTEYFFGAGSSSRKRKDPPPNDSDKDSIVRLPSRIRPENEQSRLPPPRDDKPSSSFPPRYNEPSSSFPPNGSGAPSFNEWSQDTNTSTSKRTCECGLVKTKSGRVVNGTATEKNQYNWATLIGFGKNMCRGDITTIHVVLTVAHCLFYYGKTKIPLEEITIFVGRHDKSDIREKTVKMHRVIQAIPHEDYNPITKLNDIAILVTEVEIRFNPNVGAICLPKERIPLEGKIVKGIGWGDNELTVNGSLPEGTQLPAEYYLLREVDLKIFSADKCAKRYSKFDPNTQICTYEEGKDTAQGDSGGGLLYYNKDLNRYIDVALVSYIRALSSSEINKGPLPALNTDVYSFIPWITKKIAESETKMEACLV